MAFNDIISGNFFWRQNRLQLFYLIVLVLFIMLSIWLSHISDERARYTNKLIRENRKLKSEYVSLKSKLMKKQLRSEVYKKVKERGFIIPKRRPYKIVTEE